MALMNKSYPHYRVHVRDNTIVDVAYNEVLPVHRPCYAMPAQKGEINKLVWCADINDAKRIFGDDTFKPGSKYFSMQSLYLLFTLKYNGAFIMRVADKETAKSSNLVLEAHIKEYTNVTEESDEGIPQYAVSDTGERIKERDEYGVLSYKLKTRTVTEQVQALDPNTQEPLFESDGTTPIMEAGETIEVPVFGNGVEITWKVRQLGVGESPEDVESTSTVFPILVFEATSEGVHGNNLAFSLDYDKYSNSAQILDKFKSVFYNFEAGIRHSNSSSISPINSNYGSVLSFAASKNAVNEDTNYDYNMEGVLNRAFDNARTPLPYNIYTYEDNLRIIGNKIVKAELDNGDDVTLTRGGLVFVDSLNYEDFGITKSGGKYIVDEDSEIGYMVNIVSGINLNGITYDHVAVITDSDDEDAVLLKNKSYIYLKNGLDGDWGEDALNGQYIKFFRGELPEDGSIVDKFRYPVTHIYDVGYKMSVKFEMIDFLDLRDDVAIELSTQETGKDSTLNTRALDESRGETLRSIALLQRESIVMGTGCCRCSIFPQAGKLVDKRFRDIVPFTLWSAIKHAQYGNGTAMSNQEPRGLPYSANEYFKSYNWLNFDEYGQSRVWDAGMNYCQASGMSQIFYPSLRTVYRADSSALVDQWVVDAIVYTKHVIRQAWATHVGRNDKSAILEDALINYLTNELTSLYNGKYTFETSIVRSENNLVPGFVRKVLIRLTVPDTLRVLDVEVEVNREVTTTSTEVYYAI